MRGLKRKALPSMDLWPFILSGGGVGGVERMYGRDMTVIGVCRWFVSGLWGLILAECGGLQCCLENMPIEDAVACYRRMILTMQMQVVIYI